MKKKVNVYLTNPKFPDQTAAYYINDGVINVSSWVPVPGEHFVEFTPMSSAEAAEAGVKMLNELLRTERIKFEERVAEIQDEINKFPAIEYND